MALYDEVQLKELMLADTKRLRSVNNYEEGTEDWKRKNLQILADYLWALPDDYDKFNMWSYAENLVTKEYITAPYQLPQPVCGTVACAAGHGPAAGIKSRGTETWPKYVKRVFGVENFTDMQRFFSAEWKGLDNTPKGAAQRIYQYLEKGVCWSGIFDMNYTTQQPCPSV